jgi:kynurenine formamidase
MKYVDLSYEIKNDMPVYPGDISVDLKKVNNYEEDGFNCHTLLSNMHAGTHIDCPMHMVSDGRYISELELDRFIGNAVLLDVRGERLIDIKDEYYKDIKEGDIVLLYTGWESKYGTTEYYQNHPIVSDKFAEFLVQKKIKILGVDMPSPDGNSFSIHKILLGNNICILENLTNLNKLLYVEDLQVFAQPLKIRAEASLVRAVAVYQGY